jgi:hypothetical protein
MHERRENQPMTPADWIAAMIVAALCLVLLAGLEYAFERAVPTSPRTVTNQRAEPFP